MRPFYKFKMTAAKVATLSIYDEIGPWGTSAQGFRAGMDSVAEADTINLEINSYGGDVFAGLAIYNMLMASGKTINVSVMGVAASAASLIMMAGSTRSMPKNTLVMVHNPWGVAVGNSAEMRETADLLDKIGEGLHATYAKVTGLDDEELKAMLAKDTWLSADEALEKGFATEVTDDIEAQASFKLDDADLPDHVKAIYAAAKPKAVIEPKPEPSPEPMPDLSAPVAKQVHEAAIKAGVSEHADFFAVACATMEEAEPRIKAAAEIAAICAFAKRPDDASALIRANKTVVEARVAIVEALANDDVHVTTSKPEPKPSPAAKTSDQVYADRKARKLANKRN